MLSVHLSPQQRAKIMTTTPSTSSSDFVNLKETFLSHTNNTETHHLCGQNNNNITVKRKLSTQCSKNGCCCTKNCSCLQLSKRSASLPNLSLKTPKRNIITIKSNSNNLNQYDCDTNTIDDTAINNKKTSKRNGQQQRCHNNDRRPSDRSATATTPIHDRNDINDNNINIRIPIIGYEVMEERAKFTVFKLRIEAPYTNDNWLVLRRYTDFVRLHNKLKTILPSICLPPKKIFGDNFAPSFLDRRMNGLQSFINEIMTNNHLNSLDCVREFFCLDEPPMHMDAMSECRSLFECQEETIAQLKVQLKNKDEIIKTLKQQLADTQHAKDNLWHSMRKCYENCGNCSNKIENF